MSTTTELFAASPEAVRDEQMLDHRLPEGFTSLEEVDSFCLDLVNEGRLLVCGGFNVDRTMSQIKDPSHTMGQFQDFADRILSILTQTAAKSTQGEDVKTCISLRAGDAFSPFIRRFLRGTPRGFLSQERDEQTGKPHSWGESKMGRFEGKHAILFDPMLATGGSMVDMIERAVRRGAESITTVSAFSAPQGIAQVAMHEEVVRIITTPLEAGLNEKFYIVGGHTPFPMLGDFGDRYFGPIG